MESAREYSGKIWVPVEDTFEEAVDVTEAVLEEGEYQLDEDWTEVVLFGNRLSKTQFPIPMMVTLSKIANGLLRTYTTTLTAYRKGLKSICTKERIRATGGGNSSQSLSALMRSAGSRRSISERA